MASVLVLGGARSGKTSYALGEALRAADGGPAPIMIATAEALDDEMAARIARHRDERGGAWRTVEAPLDLARALAGLAQTDVGVVDCLTLWLSNLMMAERNITAEAQALEDAVRACPARLWLVSNEVGGGIAPDNALARRFRDEAGFLHQRLAKACDAVVLVTAGLPLRLK